MSKEEQVLETPLDTHPYAVELGGVGFVVNTVRLRSEVDALERAEEWERYLGRETRSGRLVSLVAVRRWDSGEWVTVQETEY